MFEADFALRLLGMRLKDRAFVGPEVVQIDLTDDCTSNCLGCWARSPFLRDDDHYDTLEKGTLGSGFVYDLLPELAAIGVNNIFLGGGGDPLCHPEFTEIVCKVKDLGLKCTVNTNLMMATSGMMDALVEAGLDELIVSIWAADAQMYSKLHPNQSEGTFLHLENMLRYLRHLKDTTNKTLPKVKVYNVVCSLNVLQVPDMIEHGRQLGVDEVEFSILDPIPRRTHIFLLKPKQIDWLTKFFSEFEQSPPPFVHYELFMRRLHNIDVLKGVYDNGIVESIPCATGWFYSRVTTVGQVHSCLKGHRIAAGDLNEHRFGQIWYGEGQSRFRENTVKLKYDNPFLEMIGHDIDFDLPGCYRICDNLGHNQNIMRLTGALTDYEKECLDAMELAARQNATVDRLRAIHADFVAKYSEKPAAIASIKPALVVTADHDVLIKAEGGGGLEPIKEKLAALDNADAISIPLNIRTFARLPKLLALIGETTGREVDCDAARFDFKPLAQARKRAAPFLSSIKTQLKKSNIFLDGKSLLVEKVLRSFTQGLDRHSEADLLRALGVYADEALTGPRTFHLDVANGCNTNCAYCWFHSPYSSDRMDAAKFDVAWKKQLMPWEMFERLVDDLAAVGCKEDVVLSGKGEPVIHPLITDMVAHLKNKGLFTTLFTNGLQLDEKIANSCIDSGVDLLYVSLSAATEKVFKSLQSRPSKGTFDRILSNIRRFIKLREKAGSTLPKLVMVDVLCNLNAHEVEAYAKLSAEIGADHLRYQLAAIEYYNEPLKLSAEQSAKLPAALEMAKKIATEAGIEVIANIDDQMAGGDTNWSGEKYLASGCLAGWAFARAWADGTLSFCCSPKPIGNLNEKRFADWWHGAEYDGYRLGGKYIAQNKGMKFADGTPLWNDICRRCPNYEGIGHLERILKDLGL